MIEIIGSSGVYAVMGIVIVAVASLFGLVVFAGKEEKFEDVIAAQKREQEALIQSLNATSTKPSKSKKKWAKIKSQKSAKSVEKSDGKSEPEAEEVTPPEVEEDKPKVVPVVQNEESSQKRKGKNKKKGKDDFDGEKGNKPQPPVVLEEAVIAEVSSNMDQQPDLKFDSKEVSRSLKKAEKKKEKIDEAVVKNIESPILEMPPSVTTMKESKDEDHGITQKKNKGKKTTKAQISENQEEIRIEKLASDLERAPLNAAEGQKLVDILLNKQNELKQWQKPNQKVDPVEELKKKAVDLQEKLEEEKKTSLASAQKNKQLRQDIQQERTNFQRLQMQANQKIAQQGGEIQALQKRMEVAQESHLHEMQNAQSQLQQLKDMLDNSVDVKRLKEENTLLKSASMRAQQLTEEKNALLGECSQMQQNSKNLRAEYESASMQLQQLKQQNQLYEEQKNAQENEIQKLRVSKSESESVLSNRLKEVNEKLIQNEMENKNLSQQLQMVQNELQTTKLAKETLLNKSADSSGLQQQLSTSVLEIEKLAAALKTSESKLKEYQEVESRNSDLLKQLAQEKLELQEQLKNEKDEMVIVEKQPPNGVSNDGQVSQEEHIHLINEKEKIISDLKEDIKSTKKELERLATVLQEEKQEKDEVVKGLKNKEKELEDNVKLLKDDINEQKEEKKKIEEIVENLKSKNNDLREKNWKAMDALATTETNSKKKIKETEEVAFRTLKKLRPSIKLEKNKPFEDVLAEYGENFAREEEESKMSKDSLKGDLEKENNNLTNVNQELKEELNKLKNENSNLVNQLQDATKSSDSSEENMKELQEENRKANMQIEHYKTVLEETEGMLKKLQTGIESQVTNYEKKLNEKDKVLKQLNEKIVVLEETIKNNDDKSQLENDLQKVQDELNSEKKVKGELESELDETKKRISMLEESVEHYQSEDSLAQSQESLSSGAGSSSPKKKKGFKHAFSKAFNRKSEGGEDLKHRLTSLQEQMSTIEEEKKDLAKKLGSVSDSALAKDEEIKKINASKAALEKELTKLKEKVKIIEDSGKDNAKSGKEKDKIIANLRLENAELREDLQDERDRVVVDVETPETDHLKNELTSLKEMYGKEKDNTDKLNSSVHDLEEQLENRKKELTQMEEKYKIAADKIVVYEQKVKELELAGLTKSERIEMEIDEAINQADISPTSPQRSIGTPLSEQLDQVTNQLKEKEKQLESEVLANKQLRSKLATFAGSESHGTSV